MIALLVWLLMWWLSLFMLSLFLGNQLRSLHFMMKNCLGYTFAALSSHDSGIRAAGYHILSRLEEHLKASSFQRKEQYLHLLYFLQNSITTENTKVPFVNAIYMMRMGQILLNEGRNFFFLFFSKGFEGHLSSQQ